MLPYPNYLCFSNTTYQIYEQCIIIRLGLHILLHSLRLSVFIICVLIEIVFFDFWNILDGIEIMMAPLNYLINCTNTLNTVSNSRMQLPWNKHCICKSHFTKCCLFVIKILKQYQIMHAPSICFRLFMFLKHHQSSICTKYDLGWNYISWYIL